MRPAMTAPRGRVKSTDARVWPFATVTAVPGWFGRRCPYCSGTYPALLALSRSEERRVGKECRALWPRGEDEKMPAAHRCGVRNDGREEETGRCKQLEERS